jgi:hypothetical protein
MRKRIDVKGLWGLGEKMGSDDHASAPILAA